jgi:hypothetical protein
MRLANMIKVHPEQITARCSQCNEEVGVYPSGQRVMKEKPNVRLFCHVCKSPGKNYSLAPGAELEPLQSKRREE